MYLLRLVLWHAFTLFCWNIYIIYFGVLLSHPNTAVFYDSLVLFNNKACILENILLLKMTTQNERSHFNLVIKFWSIIII